MSGPPYRIKNMMPGMIMLWAGSIATIPSGWHLCDGTNGTVDLRDKFVPCAGSSYNPGDTGGSDTQTHTFTGDGHNHLLNPGPFISAGTDLVKTTTTSVSTGTTDSSNNRPQYYALAYIQKL